MLALREAATTDFSPVFRGFLAYAAMTVSRSSRVASMRRASMAW
jgi:hypothetical protein